MQNILITGASRGFGLCLTEAFVERGDRVYAGCRGSSEPHEPGRSLAIDALATRYPDLVVVVPLDVSDGSSVVAAAGMVSERTPALDVVVNNAAIRSTSVMSPIEAIDFGDVARTFDVNAIGPLRVVQAFVPLLRLGRSPILVNVSSEAGSIGSAGRDREFDYCMSKAALNMATALLTNYLRPGVRVLSLHPGWLRTDMGGPNADLDPLPVGRAVAELITREAKNPGGPQFLDHSGQTLAW